MDGRKCYTIAKVGIHSGIVYLEYIEDGYIQKKYLSSMEDLAKRVQWLKEKADCNNLEVFED